MGDSVDAARREHQWKTLAHQVDEIHKKVPRNLVLLGGDFNVCSGMFGIAVDNGKEFSKMEQTFANAGLGQDLVRIEEGATNVTNGSVRYAYVENDDAPNVFHQVLDHAFISLSVKDNATAEIVDTRTEQRIVSDHFGVGINVHLHQIRQINDSWLDLSAGRCTSRIQCSVLVAIAAWLL